MQHLSSSTSSISRLFPAYESVLQSDGQAGGFETVLPMSIQDRLPLAMDRWTESKAPVVFRHSSNTCAQLCLTSIYDIEKPYFD